MPTLGNGSQPDAKEDGQFGGALRCRLSAMPQVAEEAHPRAGSRMVVDCLLPDDAHARVATPAELYDDGVDNSQVVLARVPSPVFLRVLCTCIS